MNEQRTGRRIRGLFPKADMHIPPIGRDLEASAATPVRDLNELVPQQREIIQAVRNLNAAEMMGQDNQLQFRIDRQAKRMRICLVGKHSGEVIAEVSPEDVLRLAEDLPEEKTGVDAPL
jgi:uncharacterized FlaG/YvyC family protein